MIIYITIIIAGILLDQLTKFWASSVLSGMTTYSIIPNVLHFTYVENTGAAFNIFSDKQIFLIIITLIFIFILGYLFFLLPKTKAFNLANLALSLMLSGAIGNLIDRMTHSYVIDFIDLRIINFAVFNVADSLVVIGAFLLLYAYIKNQLVVPAKITSTNSSDSSDESKEESEVKPFRKDVLKDLKPKSINRNLQPEVRTDIIQLKSVPTPSPKSEDYQPRVFFHDYSSLYDDLNKDSEVSFVNENRFSEQSKHYQDSIKDLKVENNREEKLRTRYNDSIESYEESVNKLREEANIPPRETPIWEPQVSSNEVKSKSYEINWNPQFDKEANNARARFKDQIDHYAKSIEEQKKFLEEKEPQEEIIQVKEEIKEVPKANKNRYQELTDSYINSIKEVKNKTYTIKENEE